MRRIFLISFFFLILFTACTNNTPKEGFPFYGIRIDDPPEQAEAMLKKTGYKKNSEILDSKYIILEFNSQKQDRRMTLFFNSKKLLWVSSNVENGDFESLTEELRASFGYPSYYSADEEEAEWTVKTGAAIARIRLSRNESEGFYISMMRDIETEFREGLR